MSLITAYIGLKADAVSFKAAQAHDKYSSACATVLSMQLEQALEADQASASRGRFTKLWDSEIEAFMRLNTPNIALKEFLDKVKLPTELVQKYLGEKSSDVFFQRFPGKEMTAGEIRHYQGEVPDELDDLDLPLLEAVFSQSHAQAEREDRIANTLKESENDRWPFNSMLEEPKGRIPGPWSYLASFGAPYVVSLTSSVIAQALEADIEQMTAAGEAPSLERMGKVCREAAEKFIEANFDNVMDAQELLLNIELPAKLVQKYLNSMSSAEGYMSLQQIQQYMEGSPENSFDQLVQELDRVLPSLDAHLEEAADKAEARETAKLEAARVAAELQAKSVSHANQSWLPSLPWASAKPAT